MASGEGNGTRRSQQTLSRWLVAYGIVGLVAAAIVLAVGIWLTGDLTAEADSLATTAADAAVGLQVTAATLAQTSSSTSDLGQSLRQTTATLGEAGAGLDATAQSLQASAAAAANVSVLGLQPLAGFATSLDATADRITSLRQGVDSVGTSLTRAQPGVDAMGARLTALRDQVVTLSDDLQQAAGALRGGVVGFALWLVGGLTASVALPAGVALAGGAWLRRETARPAGTGS